MRVDRPNVFVSKSTTKLYPSRPSGSNLCIPITTCTVRTFWIQHGRAYNHP
ncbi:unnamed protein product [Nesidiocoris tenuis]|uniref:Uncharacterized protein n=1 Tax=Nesidiocoris tenuis TaxID=355587 RepID=A0A6H5HA09_9HEMI|nr:unnamed protein product [Nesidiocoris tenuis]